MPHNISPSASGSKSPLASLQAGRWFKLICGASYQALPAVRNLTLAYALAGVDCIDVAADLAVVAAAKEGLDIAAKIAQRFGRASYRRPLLMVSMSAGADPHFRKAWFDAERCPADCVRPCERVCPADAIDDAGVIGDRCYGCGRCLPICPLGLIEARSHPTTLNAIAQQVLSQADALEIHTHVGQTADFESLWRTVQPWINHLQVISISCPDGQRVISYLQDLKQIMDQGAVTACASHQLSEPQTSQSAGFRPYQYSPPTLAQPLLKAAANAHSAKNYNVIWQTDGRPMSGDIGKGTTHAAIRLAQKVLVSALPGYIQLAGGTNQHTVPKLRVLGLLNKSSHCHHVDGWNQKAGVSGIAYGSFARRLLMPLIEQTLYLEEEPKTLWKAVALAESLVKPLKQPTA